MQGCVPADCWWFRATKKGSFNLWKTPKLVPSHHLDTQRLQELALNFFQLLKGCNVSISSWTISSVYVSYLMWQSPNRAVGEKKTTTKQMQFSWCKKVCLGFGVNASVRDLLLPNPSSSFFSPQKMLPLHRGTRGTRRFHLDTLVCSSATANSSVLMKCVYSCVRQTEKEEATETLTTVYEKLPVWV